MVDIESMFLMVFQVTSILSYSEQNRVLQRLAYKLREWYDTSLDELREQMEKIGFRLEEQCIFCNDDMPEFDGIGDPICDQCDSDVDSVS